MAPFFLRIFYFLFDLFLIWPIFFFYKYNPYYSSFLRPETQLILLGLACFYSLASFISIFNVWKKEFSPGIGFHVFSAVFNFFLELFGYLKNISNGAKFPQIASKDKVVLLFLLVKIFFLPLMFNFLLDNWSAVASYYLTDISTFFSTKFFINIFFPFAISLMFLIDCALFCFGYSFEASFLKNKVRSVEPTFFGWLVALVCYPPFNGVFGNYAPLSVNYYQFLGSEFWDIVFRMVILILIFVYLWASIALGTKCSNLTNRGIVTSGPYSIIRHPAYICKTLSWWVALIPVMSIEVFLAVFIWTAVYFFRAVTEERHLISDQDYVEYCKKVKYRFIPFVF
jgi:protein-S-isoprenylcysteine O-methyltransferase Ste14